MIVLRRKGRLLAFSAPESRAASRATQDAIAVVELQDEVLARLDGPWEEEMAAGGRERGHKDCFLSCTH
jgi:hypothetical protein